MCYQTAHKYCLEEIFDDVNEFNTIVVMDEFCPSKSRLIDGNSLIVRSTNYEQKCIIGSKVIISNIVKKIEIGQSAAKYPIRINVHRLSRKGVGRNSETATFL